MNALRVSLIFFGLTLAAGSVNAAATLTATPTTVPIGGPVTATWSDIPTPLGSDWITLATPGSPLTSYITFRRPNGAASGSMLYEFPMQAGTYELRYLANNTYTLVAASNTFTVSPRLTGTVTLGGSPLAGVAFSASNGGSCSPSNASGQYTCFVPAGWTGIVTPTLAGYSFTPEFRNYGNVTANLSAQNYTAAANFQVSGTVTVGGSPLAGVTLIATNGGSCSASNASGQYTCSVEPGWSGTVTPTLSGYAFTPTSRNYTSVKANQTAQDYTAAVTRQVSGTITAGALPLGGVVLTATNSGSCTLSNGSGQYSCTVLDGWSGSVTPALSGYTFAPTSRNYTNVTSAQSAQDYTATAGAGAGTVFYIHADHLNTPRAITNQFSQVVWQWDQSDPFGGNVPNENPSGLGTFTNNIRYPGQYFDKETNLHYNYSRDYDPGIGRY
jgi:hypothetical protein